MPVDYNGAQIYFNAKNHHKSGVWSGFGQANRAGAVAAARRILARGLGRPITDTEPAYQEGDRTREEYAVYEQALWVLEHGQIADATGNDPVAVLTGMGDSADPASRSAAALYAPEALRWLGMTGGSVIRG
jgi:hypothetical protein